MTGISEIKAAARRTAFAARKAARGRGDDIACARLLELIGPVTGQVIAAYMPIRTEISPLAAMTALHKAGNTLAVPVIRGQGQPLSFHRWTPGVAMIDGPFGAAVPADGIAVEPAIVITPLVAFDRAGYRLGYGGGFYDRSFAGLRARGPCLAIGLAYSAQELANVPREDTDVRLDALVTEAETLRFS